MKPVAVGVWAPIGPTVTARVGDFVCPALPENADPGPVNDVQRTGCGLVVELRSIGGAKVRWNANPNGELYVCRNLGAVAIWNVDGPGKIDGRCVPGIRQGKAWKKSWVELSP
jgi:hypothetical protein